MPPKSPATGAHAEAGVRAVRMRVRAGIAKRAVRARTSARVVCSRMVMSWAASFPRASLCERAQRSGPPSIEAAGLRKEASRTFRGSAGSFPADRRSVGIARASCRPSAGTRQPSPSQCAGRPCRRLASGGWRAGRWRMSWDEGLASDRSERGTNGSEAIAMHARASRPAREGVCEKHNTVTTRTVRPRRWRGRRCAGRLARMNASSVGKLCVVRRCVAVARAALAAGMLCGAPAYAQGTTATVVEYYNAARPLLRHPARPDIDALDSGASPAGRAPASRSPRGFRAAGGQRGRVPGVPLLHPAAEGRLALLLGLARRVRGRVRKIATDPTTPGTSRRRRRRSSSRAGFPHRRLSGGHRAGLPRCGTSARTRITATRPTARSAMRWCKGWKSPRGTDPIRWRCARRVSGSAATARCPVPTPYRGRAARVDRHALCNAPRSSRMRQSTRAIQPPDRRVAAGPLGNGGARGQR